jgi:hypothetical protein
MRTREEMEDELHKSIEKTKQSGEDCAGACLKLQQREILLDIRELLITSKTGVTENNNK